MANEILNLKKKREESLSSEPRKQMCKSFRSPSSWKQ